MAPNFKFDARLSEKIRTKSREAYNLLAVAKAEAIAMGDLMASDDFSFLMQNLQRQIRRQERHAEKVADGSISFWDRSE